MNTGGIIRNPCVTLKCCWERQREPGFSVENQQCGLEWAASLVGDMSIDLSVKNKKLENQRDQEKTFQGRKIM